MIPPSRDEDPFVREVRRQVERARTARELTFVEGLRLVGAVGWIVVLPAVAGAVAGRWLDRWADSGVFWTLSLLVLGLALGCASAWRQVRKDLQA